MLKRNKGYLLLTLLVLTGMAGRLHSDVLPGKERRFLVKEIKNSHAEFFDRVLPLTDAQLDYRKDAQSPTIREYVCGLARIESTLWNNAKKAKGEKASGTPINKIFSEDDLRHRLNSYQFIHPAHNACSEIDEVYKNSKKKRAEALKYLRTSTDNPKTRIAITHFGTFNICQIIQSMSTTAEYCTEQVKVIQADTRFPK